MSERLHLWVSGRVQGVFYRKNCLEVAQRLRLSGWVRNLPDGRVEAVAEGDQAALDEFLEWCRIGPSEAMVSEVKLRREKARGEQGFTITGFSPEASESP